MKQIPFKKSYCEPRKGELYTNLFNNTIITNGEQVLKLSLFTPNSISAEKLSKNYINAETLENNAENNMLIQYSTQCSQLINVENLGWSHKEVSIQDSYKVFREDGLETEYCLIDKNFSVKDFFNAEKDKMDILVKASLVELMLKAKADKLVVSQIGKYSLHVRVYREGETIMSLAPAVRRSECRKKYVTIREITK